MATLEKKNHRLDKMTLLLIPLAVAINMVCYNVIYPLTTVVLGDSIGTILVGAICGPIPGLIVGLLSNLVNVIKNPVMIVMAPLNMAFGVVAGLMSKKGRSCGRRCCVRLFLASLGAGSAEPSFSSPWAAISGATWLPF